MQQYNVLLYISIYSSTVFSTLLSYSCRRQLPQNFAEVFSGNCLYMINTAQFAYQDMTHTKHVLGVKYFLFIYLVATADDW